MSQGGGESQSQVSKTSTAIASLNALKTNESKVLFPFITFLDVTSPAFFIKAALLVEMLQLLGLLVNPTKWSWGSILSGIGLPLYFINLPFWDQAYDVSVEYTNGTGFVWAIFVTIVATCVLLAYNLYAISEQLTKRGSVICQVVVHGFGGILFQPALHYLMAYTMCNTNGYLSDFPTESCWSNGVYQIILFVVAIIAIIFICLCRILITTFLFDDLPRSRHLRSRSVTDVEYGYDALVFLSVVLYHYLLADGQRQTFSALVSAGAFLVAVGHIMIVPFFIQEVNRFRVAGLFLISYVGLISTIMLEETDSDVSDSSNNWDAVVVCCGGAAVTFLGYLLANFRVSENCSRALNAVMRGEANLLNEGTFPAHLPTNERIRHRELEQVILGESTFAMNMARAQGDTKLFNSLDERKSLWVGHPFLEAIYFVSDVAASTRFLNLFTLRTGIHPPAAMLGFAVRIFSKGMARFVREPLVELEFAAMLASFCPGKTQAAMYMLEKILRGDKSLPISFRVHKKGTDIASTMLIKDGSHRKVFHMALKMHKDALQHMVMFWNKLLADSVNIVQLGQLAKIITEKREEGYTFFERVVSEGSDVTSMIRFAQFLEHVMMDHEAADIVRENVLDTMEIEAGGAVGQKSGPGGANNNPGAAVAILSGNRSSMSGADRSRTIKNLSRNINCIFGILFLIIIGLFVFGFVYSEQRLHQIDTIHFAGQSRSLVQETIFLTFQLLHASDTAEAADVHGKLTQQLVDFRTHHSSLMKGDYKPSYPDVVELFSLPRFAVRENSTHDKAGLWLMGNALINALESIVAVDPTQVSILQSEAVSFLQQNALDSAATAFNYSLEMYENEARAQVDVGQYSIVGLYLLSIFTILVVYYVLVLNFHKIIASKMSTLNLFTLIPKKALERLHNESNKHITEFDAPDDKFQKMKVARGLEDDSDAMNQVMSEVENAEKVDRANAQARKLQQHQQMMMMQQRDPNADDDDVREGEIMPKGFAAMVKNASLADVGKRKNQINDNFEDPWSKEEMHELRATTNPAEDNKMTEELIEEELRKIQGTDVGAMQDAGDADGTEAEEENKKTAETADRFITFSGVAMIFIIVVTIILGAFVLTSYNTESNFRSEYKHNDEMLKDITNINLALQRQTKAISTFAFEGTSEHYDRFVELLGRFSIKKAQQDLSLNLALSDIETFYKAQDATFKVEFDNFVAARLVCNAKSLSCPDVENTVWASGDFERQVFMRATNTTLQGSDVDLTLSSEEQIRLAQDMLGSDLYTHHTTLVKTELHHLFQSQLEKHKDLDSLDNSRDLMYPLEIAAACLMLITAITFCICIMRTHLASNFVMFVGFLIACVAAVVIGLASTLESSYGVSSSAKALYDFRYHSNATLIHTSAPMDYAVDAFVYHQQTAPLDLVTLITNNEIDNDFARMLELINIDLFTSLSQLAGGFRVLTYLSRVVTAIACNYWEFYEPPAIEATFWNFTGEVHHRRLELEYPTQLFYTDRSSDLAATKSHQWELMSQLSYGPYVRDLERTLQRNLEAAIEAHIETAYDDLDKKLDKGINIHLSMIGLVGAALAVELVTVILVLQTLVRDADSGNRGSNSGGGGGSQQDDALFTRLTRNSQLALGVVTILFSVLFVVTMIDLEGTKSRARDQNSASLREFELMNSMTIGQRANNVTRFNDWLNDVSLGIERASNSLYFGENNGNKHANAGRHNSLDQKLFGHDSPENSRFDCQPTLPVLANNSILFSLASGTDLATRSWQTELSWLTRLPPEEATTKLIELEHTVGPVLTAIRTTTDDFTSILRTETETSRIIFIVILATTFLVLLYQFLYVFRPMIGHLLHEEEGTKVMLKMIPPDVRDSIPAIAEYLETGVVLQDRKMQEINEAAADLSPIPTITIDFKGTILKFSRAAEDAFLWSKEEAVGQNVKMIQPENIAVEHDAYLARYRRTGVRKIIGQVRKIRALRRDGTLFPAEITVKEIRYDGNTTFVGALKNISVEMEFERATALSKAVSEAATVPIVVINSRGTILRFNTAAEETFGCDREIVGSNVKILMPKAEKMQHDQYLENYMRTGIKNIIDTTRTIRAKKSSGELFPAQISVRELKRGHDSIFIGYISDITKMVHLQMASMVSDAISATSPAPVVSIDEVGSIISWSPAAEKVFRVSAMQAMGKNIKMIMPPQHASKHDGYLKAYANSGRKTMIDNVTVIKAQRLDADGTKETFSVKIAIKDIVQTGKPTTFVAFIQDISQQQQLETEYKISANIRQLSSSPLITITETGIIQTFSEAAVKSFGYSEDEVIGKNVKMLMPKEIAEQHDEILSRYKETRVKNIIGTQRRVHALNSNGRKMPVEIAVHEVQVDGISTYIGYLRDVSAEFKMMEQNAVNDAISQLAVVPMISISGDGTILTCSESTCTKFMWPAEELIGQNIKVLMPDSIGLNHDEYLAKYHRRYGEVGAIKARETSTILHKQRRSMARMRDDTLFPVELHVRELLIDGMDPMFVGYVRDITEDLEKATQRHIAEVIIETSTIPLICIDRLGKVNVFSQAAEKDFGWKRDEVIGKNVKMLMPDSIAKHHDGYLRAYTKTGIKNVIDSKRQVVGIRKTGENFNVEITVKENIHKDANGNETSEYIGFVRDLTQQYILQQANMINEVVSQLATVPIIVITPRGIILDYNKAAERDFGYSYEEVFQKNIKMLMPEEIATNHDGYLQRYRATGKKTIIDNTRAVTAKKKSGEIFPVEVSVKEVKKEGAETQFLGYVRDLTLQRKVESQYETNTAIERLSAIPLIVITQIGTIRTFNKAAEMAWGHNAKNVVGQNVKMLMPDAIAENHDAYLSNYLKTGVQTIVGGTRQVKAKKANGRLFPIEISVREVMIQDGERVYIGYARNITDQVMMQAENNFNEIVTSLSPVPIVAIDHIGTITKFSASAEQEFGVAATEVIGKNVKLLQPKEVADVHDGYLSRYLNTGIKSVIDSNRQVTAKRWDGTLFQAEITVKEVIDKTDPNAKPSYVGYLRNVEEDLKIAEASKEGDTLRALCPFPVIVISPRGIIQSVNPAAMQFFQYEEDEMLQQNIKILMPEQVAMHHDSFLKRYMETGQKNVIDDIRRVVAKKKNGKTTHVEISVREMIVEGAEKRFIGYLRDVGEELRIANQLEINDAVSSLITTPIICMSPVGEVLKFNSLAESMFGYQTIEVVGKNIKMLMPSETAVNHDGFLANYQKTKEKHVVDSTRRVAAKHKNGKKLNVEIGVREVKNPDGSTLMFVGYLMSVDKTVNVGSSAEVNKVMIDLSNNAIVIMDKDGFIERVNSATRTLFKVPDNIDLVGKNVKSLMPKSTADQHDGFLRRYESTKVKTVIDTSREVIAKEVSTNREIPVEISVKEIIEKNKPVRYLGYIRSREKDIELEGVKRSSSAALNLSPYATIVIDISGVILMMSKNALDMFGVDDEKNVIGQNIKMLMPKEIADQHDGYLLAYRRTGEKHVIDQLRQVPAQHLQTREKFDVVLQIKEIKFQDGAINSVYVGFVEKA